MLTLCEPYERQFRSLIQSVIVNAQSVADLGCGLCGYLRGYQVATTNCGLECHPVEMNPKDRSLVKFLRKQ